MTTHYIVVRVDNDADLRKIRRTIHSLFDNGEITGNLADAVCRGDRDTMLGGQPMPRAEAEALFNQLARGGTQPGWVPPSKRSPS